MPGSADEERASETAMPEMIGPMVVGAVILVLGLLMTFAGVAIRRRLVGLGVMGFGAVVMLAAAGPDQHGTAWTTALAAVTLAGMLAFGVALARRIDVTEDDEGPQGIDEAPR